MWVIRDRGSRRRMMRHRCRGMKWRRWVAVMAAMKVKRMSFVGQVSSFLCRRRIKRLGV